MFPVNSSPTLLDKVLRLVLAVVTNQWEFKAEMISGHRNSKILKCGITAKCIVKFQNQLTYDPQHT